MRALSPELLAQLYGQESNDPFLMLVQISHPSITTIRLVNNTQDVISNGETFMAFPLKIVLPPDDSEKSRTVRLEIDNASLEFIDELRSITTALDVTIQMVLASTPNTVQVELTELKLRGITYDKNTISGTLVIDNFLKQELASEKYTSTKYRGLF